MFAVEIDFRDTPDHQTLLIGQEGKIKCNVMAKPSPVVDWSKNMIPLRNGELKKKKKKTRVIPFSFTVTHCT